ncbi:unnamed protein product [Microthlaspi erraticum]|uniref:Uncharacterized protein n=1 Tax=Microthlaspi erraticum TaxID=1685480 RepID=A0A6D2IGW1_9BRAS|nr:unnamed protein product [Microthlaspi erraticum]
MSPAEATIPGLRRTHLPNNASTEQQHDQGLARLRRRAPRPGPPPDPRTTSSWQQSTTTRERSADLSPKATSCCAKYLKTLEKSTQGSSALTGKAPTS